MFTRVLELVAEHGLLRGKTLGIDATTGSRRTRRCARSSAATTDARTRST
ncbi:hypothetical protein [Nannocystis pusilla]